METAFPKRKHPRLANYDYASTGAYFITICTQNRRCVLSRIVGRGLAPAEIEYTECGKIAEQQLLLLAERYPCLTIDAYVIMPNHIHAILILDNGTAGASPRPIGADNGRAGASPRPIDADNGTAGASPRPIGADNGTAGASPRPTVMDIVCAYKSLTTRECKKLHPKEKLFQTSFYEHIIRSSEEYHEITKYICENPVRWLYDELYAEE